MASKDRLKATTINAAYDEGTGFTSINVSFVYESTATIDTAAKTTNEILAIINVVPEKPPNERENFCLKSCNASVSDATRSLYLVQAVYRDECCETGGGSGGGSGGDPGGGGGRGPCLPPPKRTSTTVRAMKDHPINNKCGTPILPTPQIEVAMLQRTEVTYKMGNDPSGDENDLVDSMGKIDDEETQKQNARRGRAKQGKAESPGQGNREGHPAEGKNDAERQANAACGSMLSGGSIGGVESGPCGPYYAITKNWIDGDFTAPGIVNTGYKKCGYTPSGGGTNMHVGTVDGEKFPIVAMEKIDDQIIPWPGQPKKKKKGK